MHYDGVVVDKVDFQCSLNLSLNPACGDSTESKRIEKYKVVYLLDLFEGRLGKGQCDLVCVVHLDDWANTGVCWCLVEFRDTKCAALLQGSEMSALQEFNIRKHSYTLTPSIACLWRLTQQNLIEELWVCFPWEQNISLSKDQWWER